MSAAQRYALRNPIPPNALFLTHAHLVTYSGQLLVGCTALLLIVERTEVNTLAVRQEPQQARVGLRNSASTYQSILGYCVEVQASIEWHGVRVVATRSPRWWIRFRFESMRSFFASLHNIEFALGVHQCFYPDEF